MAAEGVSSKVRARPGVLREAAAVPTDSRALAEYEMGGLFDRALRTSVWALSPWSAGEAPGKGVEEVVVGELCLEGGSVRRGGRGLAPGVRAFNLSI